MRPNPSPKRAIGGQWSSIPSMATLLRSAFIYIDPTVATTVTGSPVSMIVTPNASSFAVPDNFQRLTGQGTADRPSLSGSGTSRRLVFDGTADVLDASAGYTFRSFTIPAPVPWRGRTPTVTGLYRNPDGTWWLGDFGKNSQATAANETYNGGLIKYSPDFSSILKAIRFIDLGLTGVGVQGIAVDEVDPTLVWCSDAGGGKVYCIDTVNLTVVKNFSIASVNGLAIDTSRHQLLTCAVNSVTITRRSKVDGSSVGTFTIRDITENSLDHLFYEINYGTAGGLYTTVRDNGTNGRVVKYDIGSGCTPVKAWSFSEIQAIEGGLHVEGNTFYTCDDQAYHQQAANVNRIASFTVDPTSPDYGTRLLIAGLFKIASTPAGTVTLAAGGDGVSTGGTARSGVGLFYGSVANQFRVFIQLPTAGTQQQAIFDFTVPSATTEAIYVVDIDTVAHTCTLTVNGTLVGTQSSANVTGSIPSLVWTLGADYENGGTAARWGAVTIGFFAVTSAYQYQAEIEGYIASQTGTKASLRSGHAYSVTAPV